MLEMEFIGLNDTKSKSNDADFVYVGVRASSQPTSLQKERVSTSYLRKHLKILLMSAFRFSVMPNAPGFASMILGVLSMLCIKS